MRIRTHKPEFWTDEGLSSVSETAALLALGLLNLADDEGYFNANPRLVKAAIFPLRDTAVSVHVALGELEEIGYIRCYQGEDGLIIGHVVSFEDHQKVNHPQPSKIKGKIKDSRNIHGTFTERSRNIHYRKGMEGNGREWKGMEGNIAPTFFEVEANPQVPCFAIPTNRKTEKFPIYQTDINHWKELYPSVDIESELRKMIGWAEDNPTRRKTRGGMNRFIGRWLSKEQDRGGNRGSPEMSKTRQGLEVLAEMRRKLDNGLVDEGNPVGDGNALPVAVKGSAGSRSNPTVR